MIYESLFLLKKGLNAYLKSANDLNAPDQVILGNIAFSEQGNQDVLQDISNKVVLTLVSIDEDNTLKNQTNFTKKDGQYERKNAPIYANLNILFSANYASNYSNALKQINNVVEYFQGQNKFSYKNQPEPELAATPNISTLEVKLEMMSLNFEQLNHLWGSLGGKVIPSVLYKARIVEIKRDAIQAKGPAITQISINEN